MAQQGKYAVAKEIRDLEKPLALSLDARGRVRFNPPTLDGLYSCNEKRLWVGFQQLSADRWALDLLPKRGPGLVKLARAKSENTATCSFGAVLADRPELKVESGRLRLIPWAIEENRFILLLDQEENIPAPKKGPGKKKSLTETHPIQLAEA